MIRLSVRYSTASEAPVSFFWANRPTGHPSSIRHVPPLHAGWLKGTIYNRCRGGRLARCRGHRPLRSTRTTPGGLREPPFTRFPTWMWRNTDVADFVLWMRGHNDKQSATAHAGFFGLDIYNMRGSIAAVLSYLDKVDPNAAAVARERYGCLTPWQREPSTYGRAVLTENYRKCEKEVVRQCQDILRKQLDYAGADPDSFLDAAQNARLIASAERYYRVMYYGGADPGICATPT